jgi:hypothetical protein
MALGNYDGVRPLQLQGSKGRIHLAMTFKQVSALRMQGLKEDLDGLHSNQFVCPATAGIEGRSTLP